MLPGPGCRGCEWNRLRVRVRFCVVSFCIIHALVERILAIRRMLTRSTIGFLHFRISTPQLLSLYTVHCTFARVCVCVGVSMEK